MMEGRSDVNDPYEGIDLKNDPYGSLAKIIAKKHHLMKKLNEAGRAHRNDEAELATFMNRVSEPNKLETTDNNQTGINQREIKDLLAWFEMTLEQSEFNLNQLSKQIMGIESTVEEIKNEIISGAEDKEYCKSQLELYIEDLETPQLPYSEMSRNNGTSTWETSQSYWGSQANIKNGSNQLDPSNLTGSKLVKLVDDKWQEKSYSLWDCGKSWDNSKLLPAATASWKDLSDPCRMEPLPKESMDGQKWQETKDTKVYEEYGISGDNAPSVTSAPWRNQSAPWQCESLPSAPFQCESLPSAPFQCESLPSAPWQDESLPQESMFHKWQEKKDQGYERSWENAPPVTTASWKNPSVPWQDESLSKEPMVPKWQEKIGSKTYQGYERSWDSAPPVTTAPWNNPSAPWQDESLSKESIVPKWQEKIGSKTYQDYERPWDYAPPVTTVSWKNPLLPWQDDSLSKESMVPKFQEIIDSKIDQGWEKSRDNAPPVTTASCKNLSGPLQDSSEESMGAKGKEKRKTKFHKKYENSCDYGNLSPVVVAYWNDISATWKNDPLPKKFIFDDSFEVKNLDIPDDALAKKSLEVPQDANSDLSCVVENLSIGESHTSDSCSSRELVEGKYSKDGTNFDNAGKENNDSKDGSAHTEEKCSKDWTNFDNAGQENNDSKHGSSHREEKCSKDWINFDNAGQENNDSKDGSAHTEEKCSKDWINFDNTGQENNDSKDGSAHTEEKCSKDWIDFDNAGQENNDSKDGSAHRGEKCSKDWINFDNAGQENNGSKDGSGLTDPVTKEKQEG